MFFDDNHAHIIYNSMPPDDKPLYSGHRTIRLNEIDLNTLQTKGNKKKKNIGQWWNWPC